MARTLGMVVALPGVELADVFDVDLAKLETRTVRAIWGPTRPCRAKVVVYCLLTRGHQTSPVMRTKYNKLVWLARVAPVPGAAQVLLWPSGHLGGLCARRVPRGGRHKAAGGDGPSLGSMSS